MVSWRGRVRSSDEPAAFRIDRQGEPETYNGNWELHFGPRSGEVPSRPSRYSGRVSNPVSEMNGVNSANFKAHEFVQRMLEERADKPLRAPQTSHGDNSFDADSALAALDAIEYALQRRRDIALKDEQSAREDLRHQLHSSLKKRDEVLQVADSVASAVSIAAEAGKKATTALEGSIASLSRLVDERKHLIEARDLVQLLTATDDGLNIVRASEILAKLRFEAENGALNSILAGDDFGRAMSELSRCENELSERLSESLKEKIVSEDLSLLRNCAIAAENLQREDKFVYAYISHLPIFAKSSSATIRDVLEQGEHFDGSHAHEVLMGIRRDCTGASRNFLPIAISSFPKPMRVLSKLVKKLFHEKLVRIAKEILTAIREHSAVLDDDMQDLRMQLEQAMVNDFKPDRAADNAGELSRQYCISAERSLDARQRLLCATSSVFKTLTASVHELVEICLHSTEAQLSKSRTLQVDSGTSFTSFETPSMKAAANAHFSEALSDLLFFLCQQQRTYVVLEKMWVDEKLGNSFAEISKLEARASQLAPSDFFEPEAYHRYRSFYSPIASAHGAMTQNATSAVLESLRRASSMLMISIQVNALCGFNDLDSIAEAVPVVSLQGEALPTPAIASFASAQRERSEEYSAHEKEQLRRLGFQSRVSDLQLSGMDLPGGDQELHHLITTISYSLVQNYLANAETLLQAASYLLPTTGSTAAREELWATGTSPLSAYVEAIGALTNSDKLLDDFLTNIALDNIASEPLPLAGFVDADIASSVQVKIRNEIRRELISGLKDLAVDAKVGVEAAISAVGTRLLSILATPGAFDAYATGKEAALTSNWSPGERGNSGLENEPSVAFATATTFIEQQLQACEAALDGNNLQYLIVCLAETVRDVVIQHWSQCTGPFSKTGALLLMVNARTIVRAFPAGSRGSEIVSVLSVLAQLHFDSPDEVWGTLESDSLARLKTSAILKALEKRGDLDVKSLQKIHDALSVADEDEGFEERTSVPWVFTSPGGR